MTGRVGTPCQISRGCRACGRRLPRLSAKAFAIYEKTKMCSSCASNKNVRKTKRQPHLKCSRCGRVRPKQHKCFTDEKMAELAAMRSQVVYVAPPKMEAN